LVNDLIDAFHTRYNGWRLTNGSCPQATVRAELGDFAGEFRSLVDRVEGIRRPSVARPLAEQLIQASITELEALELLRDSWEPYDQRPWRAFSQRREQADIQRRQVRSSLDELLFSYGLQ